MLPRLDLRYALLSWAAIEFGKREVHGARNCVVDHEDVKVKQARRIEWSSLKYNDLFQRDILREVVFFSATYDQPVLTTLGLLCTRCSWRQ